MPITGGAGGGKFDTDTFPLACTAFVGRDADVQAIADDFTNVWYADGSADDVQIQAAVDYVGGLGGGCICLGQGDYDVSTPIIDNGYNDIVLRGSGWDTVLTLANGVDDNMFSITSVSGWIICDMKLDGDYSNQTDGNLIDYDTVTGGKVIDVYLTHAYRYAVNIEDSLRVELRGLYMLEGGGDDDVSIHGSTTVEVVDCISINHRYDIGGAIYSGFEVEDGSIGVTISNCITWSTVGTDQASHCGFSIHNHSGQSSPTGVIISNCVAVNQGRYGFHVDGVSDGKTDGNIQLVNCSAVDCKDSGVYVDNYVDNLVIDGGVFTGMTWSAGVRIRENCENINIRNIRSYDNPNDIQIENASVSGTSIRGCTLESATKLDDSGSDTVHSFNDGLTKVREVYYALPNPDGYLQDWACDFLPDGSNTYLRMTTCKVPHDFESAVSASILCASGSTGDVVLFLKIIVAAVGEALTTHSSEDTKTCTIGTANQLYAFEYTTGDLSSLDDMSIDDYFAIELARKGTDGDDDLTDSLALFGVVLEYNSNEG